MIRVLIVDDSAFARKVLRETLCEKEGFDVVAYARDGLEALEVLTTTPVDVVTLDLVMPNLDGVGLLHALQELHKPPQVIVVSMADASSALGIEALQTGAFDLVHKPTALPTERLYDLAEELRSKVRAAAAGRMPRATILARAPTPVTPRKCTRSIVAVGTSTGGPPALTRLLSDLPADFPVPLVMVLHIPVGYTEALAARLDAISALRVVEACHGMALEPGLAVLARSGVHLRVLRTSHGLVAQLSSEPVGLPHCPAVDVLFESVASEGRRALALVLTGMGDDGLAGARALAGQGGAVLTEAEESCVVYGMPRAIKEAALSAAEAPIDDMAALLMRYL